MASGSHICGACDYDGRILQEKINILEKELIKKNAEKHWESGERRGIAGVFAAVFFFAALFGSIAWVSVNKAPNPPAQVTNVYRQPSVVADTYAHFEVMYAKCIDKVYSGNSGAKEMAESCNKSFSEAQKETIEYLKRVYPNASVEDTNKQVVAKP